MGLEEYLLFAPRFLIISLLAMFFFGLIVDDKKTYRVLLLLVIANFSMLTAQFSEDELFAFIGLVALLFSVMYGIPLVYNELRLLLRG